MTRKRVQSEKAPKVFMCGECNKSSSGDNFRVKKCEGICCDEFLCGTCVQDKEALSFSEFLCNSCTVNPSWRKLEDFGDESGKADAEWTVVLPRRKSQKSGSLAASRPGPSQISTDSSESNSGKSGTLLSSTAKPDFATTMETSSGGSIACKSYADAVKSSLQQHATVTSEEPLRAFNSSKPDSSDAISSDNDSDIAEQDCEEPDVTQTNNGDLQLNQPCTTSGKETEKPKTGKPSQGNRRRDSMSGAKAQALKGKRKEPDSSVIDQTPVEEILRSMPAALVHLVEDARRLLEQVDSDDAAQDSESWTAMIEISVRQLEAVENNLSLEQKEILNRLKQLSAVPPEPQTQPQDQPQHQHQPQPPLQPSSSSEINSAAEVMDRFTISDSELQFLLEQYGKGVKKRSNTSFLAGLCACNTASCMEDASGSNYHCRRCKMKMMIWHCMEPDIGATSICSSCLLVYNPSLVSILFQGDTTDRDLEQQIPQFEDAVHNHINATDLLSSKPIENNNKIDVINGGASVGVSYSKAIIDISNSSDDPGNSLCYSDTDDQRNESVLPTSDNGDIIELDIQNFPALPVNQLLLLVLAVGDCESNTQRTKFWSTQEITADQLGYLVGPDMELSLDYSTTHVIVAANNGSTSFNRKGKTYYHFDYDFKRVPGGVDDIYADIGIKFGRMPDVVILDYFRLQEGWLSFGQYGNDWIDHAIYALLQIKSMSKVKALIIPVDKRGDMQMLAKNSQAKLEANRLEAVPISLEDAEKNLFFIEWDEVFHARNPTVLSRVSKVFSPEYQRHRYLNYDPAFFIIRSKSEGALVLPNPRVETVYKLIRKATGTLSGAGDGGSTYGEITMGCMSKIIEAMKEKCEFDHKARFIDIGHGLGKPSFHVAQDPSVRLSFGVESEEIRWQLSNTNLFAVLPYVDDDPKTTDRLHGNLYFLNQDIKLISSLDPFTHIYQFDRCFPEPIQMHIARKFNASVHARYLISYRPPEKVIGTYGFKVEYLHQLSVKLSVSKEGKEVYFYKRIISGTDVPVALPDAKKVMIHGRAAFDEEAVEVFCDRAFYKPLITVISGVEAVRANLQEVVSTTNNKDSSRRSNQQMQSISTVMEPDAMSRTKPVILLLNVSRAQSLGNLRANNIEARSGATVITVKQCSSLPEVQDGKLVHIRTDFRNKDGMEYCLNMLSKHNLPTPWAVIMDYLEPFSYGKKEVGGSMWETLIKEMIVYYGVRWVFLPVDPSTPTRPSSCFTNIGQTQFSRLSKYGIFTVEIPQVQVLTKVFLCSMDQASVEISAELSKASGKCPKTVSDWLLENTSPDTAYLVFGAAPYSAFSDSAAVSEAERALLYNDSESSNCIRKQGYYNSNASILIPRHVIQSEQSFASKIRAHFTSQTPHSQPLKIKIGSIQHVYDQYLYVQNYKKIGNRGIKSTEPSLAKSYSLLERSKPLCVARLLLKYEILGISTFFQDLQETDTSGNLLRNGKQKLLPVLRLVANQTRIRKTNDPTLNFMHLICIGKARMVAPSSYIFFLYNSLTKGVEEMQSDTFTNDGWYCDLHDTSIDVELATLSLKAFVNYCDENHLFYDITNGLPIDNVMEYKRGVAVPMTLEQLKQRESEWEIVALSEWQPKPPPLKVLGTGSADKTGKAAKDRELDSFSRATRKRKNDDYDDCNYGGIDNFDDMTSSEEQFNKGFSSKELVVRLDQIVSKLSQTSSEQNTNKSSSSKSDTVSDLVVSGITTVGSNSIFSLPVGCNDPLEHITARAAQKIADQYEKEADERISTRKKQAKSEALDELKNESEYLEISHANELLKAKQQVLLEETRAKVQRPSNSVGCIIT